MDVTLPNLGEGADSGTVVNIFVKEGDTIAKDQPILELENEKAVATIPSTATGVVSKVHIQTGVKISAGQRMISVTESGAAASGPPAAAKALAPKAQPAAPQPAVQVAAPRPSAEPAAPPLSDAPIAAAPSIRRLAADLGLDLRRVRGSECGGRITLADVRQYIQQLLHAAEQPSAAPAAAAKLAAVSVDFSKWGGIYKKPMSSLRQIISRRMSENWNAVPHVTQFADADLTTVLALRKKYVDAYEKAGARLTVTTFVLKAIVATLKKHPIFNSSLDEAAQEIVFKEYYHLGIAVDTEAGLLVPVIRDADKKSLVELSKELEQLAKKARDRKLSPDELKGGSFTISNQGGIGGAHFTPIVNRPEVAILGLGKGSLQPVVVEGKIEPRMLLPLGLSYDHRVIDGGAAARFIVDFVQALETFKEEDARI